MIHRLLFRFFREHTAIVLLLVVIVLAMLKPSPLHAQFVEPVGTNDLKSGSVTTGDPTRSYSFYARKGEILDIVVRRAQGEIVPQFTVLLNDDAIGVWYAYAHGQVSDDFAGGPIQFTQDGEYRIDIKSRNVDQQGSFVLSIASVLLPEQLEMNSARSGQLAQGERVAFAFQADSLVTSRLIVKLADQPADLEIVLQNGRTDVLASIIPPLLGSVFNIPRGLDDYLIIIRSGPDANLVRYEVTLQPLEATGTESSFALGPDGLPVLPNAGDCVIATRGRQTVNVRSGPSLESVVLYGLAPTAILEVAGRNAENNWYQVRLDEDRTGWVAAWVTRLGGNCETTFVP